MDDSTETVSHEPRARCLAEHCRGRVGPPQRDDRVVKIKVNPFDHSPIELELH